ncbi:hypothetical protein L1049_004128 [Liquidambar formosana]|uniref:UBA domain-containing protein n=1 Tax=Liquidambar formosana TaxID=63359 RepID=A0AAP0RNZ3_LIQFO
MAIPQVDKKLLGELEEMGFSLARATRALHFSGNASLETASNWIVDHDNDSDIDEMPLVPINIDIESAEPSFFTEEMKIKAQELISSSAPRDRAHKKKEEEEKKLEREREKERIRAGKELLEAKRSEDVNERQRMITWRKAEKEEEKRAREKIRQKLQQDKVERRLKLGLPRENPAAIKPSTPGELEIKNSLPLKSDIKAEHMRECLRFIKRNYKDDDARVKRAFQTLLIYVGNVAKNPNEEKFRKIRFSNPSFQVSHFFDRSSW